MAEYDRTTAYDRTTVRDGDVTARGRGSRGIDVVCLLAGVATLLVSVYVLSDGDTWLSHIDLRWVLAGGAVMVGVLMLAASMRGGRQRD